MSILATTANATSAKANRFESIDLLRGMVMIIMALDHVRDFFHASAFLFNPTDLSRTSPFIFFTRWITHFCAPVFVFLAGISARLSGAKRTKRELSYFLLTRGIWLIFIEIVVMSFALSFNPAYPFIALQVIWAIGFCMISLSIIIYFSRPLILVIALGLIFGHNLLDGIVVRGQGIPAFLWCILHVQGIFRLGPTTLLVAYPVIPWIGVMTLGYFLGSFYLPGYDPVKRRRQLSWIGWGAILLFIALRLLNIYGDPLPWSIQKNEMFTFLSFLNTSKYPPSLLYLLMTLGPALAFLSLAEKPLRWLSKNMVIYGRVPLFYYVIHFYWLHLLAMLAASLTGYKWSDMVLTTFVTFSPNLKGFGFNLTLVYLIWIGIVLSLYPLCKWYDKYKSNHRGVWWLSYL
jgi:uncharacterized membrane protein